MPPTLTRTRSVLHVDPTSTGDRTIEFARIVDYRDEPQRGITIDRDAWEDMGCPHMVTVTIEPGDLLNDDA